MTPCLLCNKPACKAMTWVNSGSNVDSIGNGFQGGPMCITCMEFTWDTLSRFPFAKETITIWPILQYNKETSK